MIDFNNLSTVVQLPPKPNPEFLKAIQGEDELGVVVRSHIHVEALLNEYLELVVPAPKHLQGLGLRYKQKVQLACVLGFDIAFQGCKGELMDGLVTLGEIRNAFAHKPNAQITAEMVRRLDTKLPSSAKKVMSSVRLIMQTKYSVRNHARPATDTVNLADFILLVIYIEMMCKGRVEMVKQALAQGS